MPLCRYIIKPVSPWSTPLRSNTLAGMLLYRIAEDEGELMVKTAIEAFRSGENPFAVSSAFPSGFLPMPMLPALPSEQFRNLVKKGCFAGNDSLLHALQTLKKFRKLPFIPVSLWEKHCHRLSFLSLFTDYCADSKLFSVSRSERLREPHVTIRRDTSTAVDGELFFRETTCFAPGTSFDLYADTDDHNLLLNRLRRIGELGFGKDASSGRGLFTVEMGDSPVLPVVEATHTMLLSLHAVPLYESIDGWYSMEVQHGKTGPSMGANPFKIPYLCLKEGSMIATPTPLVSLLEGLHVNPDVVQLFSPITLPCRVEV